MNTNAKVCPQCGAIHAPNTVICPTCGFHMDAQITEESEDKAQNNLDISSVFCPRCGRKIEEDVKFCSNCGCEINYQYLASKNKEHKQVYNPQPNPVYVSQYYYEPYPMPIKKANSALSVWACLLALFTITAPIAFILGLVDLGINDKTKKHTGSWFAIIYTILIGIAIGGWKTNDKEDVEITLTTESASEQTAAEENEYAENDDSNELKIGSSFEKNGLKITVNNADLNYTDYSDDYGWYTPKDGMKYIMVSFTFENNGDGDTYVSIYDFDCYADNTACEQAFLKDDSDFINTNLSKGRNVTFQTYYQVPVDAQSIELEYEIDAWTGQKAIIKLQ